MDNKRSKRIWIVVALLLILVPVLGMRAFAGSASGGVLRVAALNIGQGDSIYIEAPNGKQMIFDGGPDSSIMTRLGEVMPFGDTSIDVLVVTNPDKDHYAGFLNVLEKYQVGMVLEPGTTSTTAMYKKLEDVIASKNIPELVARKGMKISLDQARNVSFDVLFPDRDVSNWATNDGSIVGKIVYGTTSFMMMGDATAKTENIILKANPSETIKSTVLKAGHHGSRTSSSDAWVGAVAPTYALISAGAHNKYGHPHQETLDTFAKYGVKVLGTYALGNVELDSDGIKVWQK